MIRRKRPRRKGDKYELLRGVAGANVPDLVRARKRKKDVEPEAVLQHQVNDYLRACNIFQFRLSEHVLDRAHDWTVKGWPDSPMIAKLPYRVALLAPLELKREGEEPSQDQINLGEIIGTQVTDNWPCAEAYIKHFQRMTEYIGDLLRKNPPPWMKAEQ